MVHLGSDANILQLDFCSANNVRNFSVAVKRTYFPKWGMFQKGHRITGAQCRRAEFSYYIHFDKCCCPMSNTSWHDEVTKQICCVSHCPVQQTMWKACMRHVLPAGAERKGCGFTMNLCWHTWCASGTKPGSYRCYCCFLCCQKAADWWFLILKIL